MHTGVGRQSQRCQQRLRRELAGGSGQGDQLGAAGVEFGRTALLEQDVRGLVAVDRSVGWADGRQGQTIGGRAGGDREDR